MNAPPYTPLQASQQVNKSNSLDLTAVSISDLLLLYGDYIDPNADLVICPEAVIDDRLITVKSRLNSIEVVRIALAEAGYIVNYEDGLLKVCRSRSIAGFPAEVFGPGDSNNSNNSNSSNIISQNSSIDGPIDVIPLQMPQEAFLEPMHPVDALLSSGSTYTGCTKLKNKIYYIFNHSSYGPQYYTVNDMKKSEAFQFLRCAFNMNITVKDVKKPLRSHEVLRPSISSQNVNSSGVVEDLTDDIIN